MNEGNMDCGSVKAKLIDLVYGELSPAEDRALREHCQHCPGCAKELEALTETLELTRRVPEPELPPFLNTRVLAHAREQAAMKTKPAGRWAWLFRPQVAMAAVAMIAASIVIVIAAERGTGPRIKYKSAVPQQEKPESALVKPLDTEPEFKGAGGGAQGLMQPAPAAAEVQPTVPSAPAEAAANAPAPSTPAPSAPATNTPAPPALRAQAPADTMRAREELQPAGPSATPGAPARAMADANAVQERAQLNQSPVPSTLPVTSADNQGPAGGAGAAAPAPPAPAAERSTGGGMLGFHAESISREPAPSAAAPEAKPVAPPPRRGAAPASASPKPAAAPAPSAPPASASGQAKSMKFDEQEEDRMKEAAPPSPDQLIATAAALEKEGKYADALVAYQQALAGLGYASGKDNQPSCSPLLKQALQGVGRCQTKLGKKADADATAAALKKLCK